MLKANWMIATLVLVGFVSMAPAATYYLNANGSVGSTLWSSTPAGGESIAEPTTGDTNIWDLNGKNLTFPEVIGGSEFFGGTLVVEGLSDTLYDAKTGWKAQSLNFGNGASIQGGKNNTAAAQIKGTLTMTGGTGTYITGGGNVGLTVASMAGSGTLRFAPTPSNTKTVTLTCNDVGSFTGIIQVAAAPTGTGAVTFRFNTATTEATFGMELTTTVAGKLLLDTGGDNLHLTSLSLGGEEIAAGDYVKTDFTVAQQAFIGTVGTISIVPEPATMSLLALGGMAMLKRRKK